MPSDRRQSRLTGSPPPVRQRMPEHSRAVELDERSHARLRWRCRRGMLENDLILARFLDARDGRIDGDEMAALDRLLGLADNELWELLSGRVEPNDESLRPLLASLRAA